MRYNGKTIKRNYTKEALRKLSLPQNKEAALQHAIVQILEWYKIMFFHVPNETNIVNPVTRALMRLIGVRRGVSDLVLVLNNRTIFLEVKTESKESKQSDKQIEWQKEVEKRGHTYLIWRSTDEAEAFVKELKK